MRPAHGTQMLDRTPRRLRRSSPRWGSVLTFVLLSIAATPDGGPGAFGPAGVSSQDSGNATPAGAGRSTRSVTAGEPLRLAVKGRFLIGAAVSARRLDDPRLAALIGQQFDCLTAENEFKPGGLQPKPGEFRFATADRFVDFARRHDMKVVGHTLCWHSQSP